MTDLVAITPDGVRGVADQVRAALGQLQQPPNTLALGAINPTGFPQTDALVVNVTKLVQPLEQWHGNVTAALTFREALLRLASTRYPQLDHETADSIKRLEAETQKATGTAPPPAPPPPQPQPQPPH
ncbi:MAG TPA: hypothetical protein VGL39_17830 [Jatrophihabitantaceae bacterium]